MVTPAPDHGRLRASHADREQVVDLLKAAFVQGRLTQDELDGRIGQALAARTYAELATATADLPAEPERAPTAAPAPAPARAGTQNRSANRAVKSGAAAIGAVIVVLSGTVLALGQPAAAVLVALFMTVLAAVATAFVSALIAVALKVETRRQDRSRRRLPLGTASGTSGQATPPPSYADPARRPRRRSPGSLAVGPAS
jgi:Domain of unknown function (DUF1707)